VRRPKAQAADLAAPARAGLGYCNGDEASDDDEPGCGLATGGECLCTGRPGCLAVSEDQDDAEDGDDGEPDKSVPWPAGVIVPAAPSPAPRNPCGECAHLPRVHVGGSGRCQICGCTGYVPAELAGVLA
jgi:hypothetical protein